jgi:peroxiredoxin
MKKQRYLLPLLFLLPGTLLAQKLRLQPEKPQPGQSVQLTYDPTGTKLAGAPAIGGVVYWLRSGGDPIAQEFTPSRAGQAFGATLTVPDTVVGMALVFEHQQKREANGGKGYLYPLYTGTQPVAGAGAALGQVHLDHYNTVGLEDRDTELARGQFEEEFQRYPASKRKHLQPYLFAFSPRREEDRAVLQREADAFAKLPDLTAEELDALARAYQQARQPERTKALTEQRNAKFGKSDRDAFYALFRAVDDRKPLTLAQRKAAYDALMAQYPAAPKPYHRQLHEYAYDRYLRVLADSGRADEVRTLTQQAPAGYELITMNAYNQIGRDAVKAEKNQELALPYVRQALDWAEKRIGQPAGPTDSPTQTATQLRKQQERTYASFASTYGQLLLQQGKAAEALPHLETAAKRIYEYRSAATNDRYLAALEAVRPDAVQAEAEAMLRIGQGTPAMEKRLHEAYVRNRANTREYEAFRTDLRRQAAEYRRTELREKLMTRPAPAFSLVDLDGKAVTMADLKGKTVIVDFWATWCGPCIASFPAMKKAQESFKDDPNVVFLFINSWQQEADKRKTAGDFIAKNGYPFTVLMDEKDEVISAFKVSGIPTKFIIDGTGTIRFRSIGFGAGTDDSVVEELRTMVELVRESGTTSTGR